jgi:3-hydroxyisobutyrate dehydrogenase-like beta-hydroxyacid dehydrogenase
MDQIGFIGVGSMGARMARRLHQAGYGLTVCDRNPAALREFENLGTAIADMPSACGGSDVVILMVANDAQLKEVVLAPNGLLSGIDAGAPPLVAVMSTVLPETIRDIAEPLSRKKVTLLDAPVSGGLAGAEAGTLTIMAGGAQEDLERVRPILQDMGTTIFHCGELGSGQLTKIVNNMVGVTNLFLVAEVMMLAKRCGLEPERLAAIMDASSGRTAYTRDWAARQATYGAIAASPDRMQSHVDICRKDLNCALTLANDAHIRMRVFENIATSVATGSCAELRQEWLDAFSR